MRITKEIFPINLEKQSVEIPDSGGVRQSPLAPLGVLLEYLHEDTKTLVDAFKRGQKLSNNGPCLGWRDSNPKYKWLSYGEVIERSKNISYGLVQIGVKRGQDSRIGIYCKNSVEFVLVEQACYLQSAILVPLYDTLGSSSCTYALNNVEAELLVCDNEKKAKNILDVKEDMPTLCYIVVVEKISDQVKSLAVRKGVAMYQLEDIEKSGKQSRGSLLLPGPSDVATICFTSGTTGDPKGVMLEHGQIIIGVDAFRRNIGLDYLGVGDRMMSYLPSAHLFDRLCQFVMYTSGGSVGFFRNDTRLLFDDVKALEPTLFPGVPRVFNKTFDRVQNQFKWNPAKRLLLNVALQVKKAELERGIIRNDSIWDRFILKSIQNIFGGKLRLMISSAAPLRNDVLEFFKCSMGCPVIELYGQTETCIVASAVLADYKTGIIGSPVPCYFTKLEDVPEMGYYTSNNEGELLVKGHAATKGYFRNPVKTAELIDKDGWLHTGDIGRWTENGALAIIDRKKHLLKLAYGEYISPEKIENIYMRSPYIDQIFVHGDSLENYLIAIASPNKEEVLSWCTQQNIYGDWEDICGNKVVKAHVLKELNELGKKMELKSIEQVKAIHLHPEVFSLQNGFLTETLKLKREKFRWEFKDVISELYEGLR